MYQTVQHTSSKQHLTSDCVIDLKIKNLDHNFREIEDKVKVRELENLPKDNFFAHQLGGTKKIQTKINSLPNEIS